MPDHEPPAKTRARMQREMVLVRPYVAQDRRTGRLRRVTGTERLQWKRSPWWNSPEEEEAAAEAADIARERARLELEDIAARAAFEHRIEESVRNTHTRNGRHHEPWDEAASERADWSEAV